MTNLNSIPPGDSIFNSTKVLDNSKPPKIYFGADYLSKPKKVESVAKEIKAFIKSEFGKIK